jgi:hypothetical protein
LGGIKRISKNNGKELKFERVLNINKEILEKRKIFICIM